MHDKIVRQMHEVLGAGLDLKERLERGEVPAFETESERLRGLVLGDGELAQDLAYNGELAVLVARPAGAEHDFGERFLGARYALTCWLDELFILDTPHWWSERWEANTLETALYGGTQQRAWRFWDQARKAEGPRGAPAALEAYLWCVVLGFRGQPPEDLNPAAWVDAVRTRVLSARRSEFPAPPERDLPITVPPLRGRERFARMLRVALAVAAVAAFAAGLLVTTRLTR
jgi:type VI protein secretion system component VasF